MTVCGFAGSEYSVLTDALGEGVFVGKDWLTWNTPILVVMRQHLSDAQARVLSRVGVQEPRVTVSQLGIGEALVVTRRHND